MIGMEFCTCASLEQYVNGETMDESLIKSFAHQILAEMLDYSVKEFVHGDIKPENILVYTNGEIKLSDFGFTRIIKSQSLKVGFENMRRYFSPEITDGETKSIKSDVWALGVVLLELAYGRDAFKDIEIGAMSSINIKEEFESKGGHSNEMSKFIARCFERESTKRATVEDDWLRDAALYTAVPIIEPSKNNQNKYN